MKYNECRPVPLLVITILSSDWSASDSDWPGAACYRSPGKDPSLPPSCRSLQRGEDDRTIQDSDWSQHPHTGL